MRKIKWIKRGMAVFLSAVMLLPICADIHVAHADEKRQAVKKEVQKKEAPVSFNRDEDEKIQRRSSNSAPTVMKGAPLKLLAGASGGRFSETLQFSLPKLSDGPYEDIVSFSLLSWNTTGAGRNDSGSASIELSQSGNNCTVIMSNLLDYETYTVVVGYVQTYFYDVIKTGTKTNPDGSTQSYSYTVKESKTVTGSLSGSKTTPHDTVIRTGYDLNEKVHKYSYLTLGADIDCGLLQSDVDGSPRKQWLVSGNISEITIAGNGNTIIRQQDGFIFHIYNDATLILKQITLGAYSGSLVNTKTVGGEYETTNPTGNACGCGIEVGLDSAFDKHGSSSGHLIMQDAVVLAHNSAVTARNGSADIRNSHLYGMGEKDIFSYDNLGDYIGAGLLAQNSGSTHLEVRAAGSRIYGRYNGMLVTGDVKAETDDCEVRGDCGDAFDFRSSGSLDIKGCLIYGAKGIDIFDDATYSGIKSALNGSHFDKDLYKKMTGKKGTVTVSDTLMSLTTGAFRGNATLSSYGIQNRGNLILKEAVKIRSAHSGAWSSVPSDNRADSCGIYNVADLTLPDDICIISDDIGITENRDIGAIRNTVSLRGGDSQEASQVEKTVTANNDLSDIFDMGDKSILTVTGGEIRAGNTAIRAPFGSVYLEPVRTLTVYGKLLGILTGINGPDNIFGDDAKGGYLEISGDEKNYIQSSLQGTGIYIKESSRAVMTSHGTEISNYAGPCGTGIKNEGGLFLKDASIKASKAGIKNHIRAKAYIGDDLDEKGNYVYISGAVCGIVNDGTCFYNRDVNIENSLKAAVWQNGIFYMLPGSVVTPGGDGNSIYLTSVKKDGKIKKSTVRILYEDQYESELTSILGELCTAENDRAPGRVMVELYSADGTTDLSETGYKKLNSVEKLRITRLLKGFSLGFKEIKGHDAALRCGLGSYEIDKNKDRKLQPAAGTATNGRTGTIVLSCLLSGKYNADFPVRDSRISEKTPENTEFYWREPTEFKTAPLSIDEDRCRIYWEKNDVTYGLKQMGYRDKNENGYGSSIYDSNRIIRIYDDDHTFYAVWDTDFTLIFDGNGQTNKTENYSYDHIGGDFVFDGNTGPDGKYEEYFIKSIRRKKFDYELMSDLAYDHQTSFQGWSFDKAASYRDTGVFCKGDRLHGSQEIISMDRQRKEYPNYDALAFYVYALDSRQVSLEEEKADVKVYAVWDEFPVISAQDISFYANELSDEKKVKEKLLSEDSVTASDHEDGLLDREEISVYTDPVSREFSIDAIKQMGDLGSATIYYSVTDKLDADTSRFRRNTSVTKAKLHVLSEDAEDTADDIPETAEKGNAGNSTDSYYSSPVYVRSIGASDYNTLEAKSVWKEDSYKKILGQALGENSVKEKWEFDTDDIKKSKRLLYQDNADVLTWKNAFIENRLSEEKVSDRQENKPLIVEEGLASVRLTWDIKSETDLVKVTLSQWGQSEERIIKRNDNQKMKTGTVFNDLTPDSTYLVTAEFYCNGDEIMTCRETVHTRKLEKPKISVYKKDEGDRAVLNISFDKDTRARKYQVERRCLKGKENTEWKIIKEIDEFSVNQRGERYMDSDVIRFDTVLLDEGVYRYHVRAIGSRLGTDDLSETGDYSEEYETAFLRKPEITETEAGCRSIQMSFAEDTQADFIRIYYQAETGEAQCTDIVPDQYRTGCISEKMTDNTVYGIRAQAYIVSPEGGMEYTGLKSDTVSEKTVKLIAPELIYDKHEDLYTGNGIRLVFRYDHHADGYEFREDMLYPKKSAGVFCRGDYELIKGQKKIYGEYMKKGGNSRVSEYMVRAVYKTLDGKSFYLESEKARAAYIRMQKASGSVLERGEEIQEKFLVDDNASSYLVVTESVTQTEEIYVPFESKVVNIYSPDRDRKITNVKTVLFYEGKEYRAV